MKNQKELRKNRKKNNKSQWKSKRKAEYLVYEGGNGKKNASEDEA